MVGCQLNNPDSCSYSTFLYFSGFVGTREPDYKQAVKTAERGCKLNEINSCVFLTKAYKEGLGCEKNEEKSKELAEKVKDITDQMKSNPKVGEMQRYT